MYKEEKGRGGEIRRKGRRKYSSRTMRTSTGAAIGIIPELMNMHSSLSRRVVSLDLEGNNGGSLFRSLFETHRSAHRGVPAENCYCRDCQPHAVYEVVMTKGRQKRKWLSVGELRAIKVHSISGYFLFAQIGS